MIERIVVPAIAFLLMTASLLRIQAGSGELPAHKQFRAKPELRTDAFLDGGVAAGINNVNDYAIASIAMGVVLGEAWNSARTGTAGHWTAGGMLIPILNGPESLMGGLFIGHRITWDRGSWQFFVEGRGGAGLIDSRDVREAQGQDFVFHGAAQIGVQWILNADFILTLGLFYNHISNGNLSEPDRPNVGLDTIGPLLGARWQF